MKFSLDPLIVLNIGPSLLDVLSKNPYTVADKKSSCFFSVQRNATEGKRQRNGNATESLTFRSCNSLEPQMLYLVFNSTFPSLPLGAKTVRTSNSYLVLLFCYSRREVHAQLFVSVCHS